MWAFAMRAHARGFTLVEAVIALLVASVLLAIAVPAWSGALARTHAAAARAALLASLQRAIGHAAVAGAEVVLCPASGEDCTTGWDWSGGWIAYADIDGDRHRDPNETLLQRQPALDDDIRLFTSKGRRHLVFQPNGGNAGSNVTFTLCSGRGARSATLLVLSNTGSLRAARASDARASACTDRGGD
jgi:type IV fimbrial biogenesis protein FimT